MSLSEYADLKQAQADMLGQPVARWLDRELRLLSNTGAPVTSHRRIERSLADMIRMVALQRHMHNGVAETHEGNMYLVKYTLEDAALRLGVRKKTLDDYQLQIRKGFLMNYDFDRHSD